MATKKKAVVEPIEKDDDDNLDVLLGMEEGEEDLLGSAEDDEDLLGEESLMEKAQKGTLGDVEKKVSDAKAKRDSEKALAKALKAKEKEAAAEAKKNAPPKELKGVKVEFLNKAGEKITGNGVLYYVVRMNGKLHYKEASQVTLL